ncbi:hypothetical protein D3C71_2229250 [compost metagenome]
MENKHIRRLKEKFGQEISMKRVIRLDIPDDFQFMDEELIEILKIRVSEYIEVPE